MLVIASKDVRGGSERRIVVDRRKKPSSFLSWHTIFGGRRRTVRRKEDRRRHVFVDHYGFELFITLLLLLLLSILDAYLTLALIEGNLVTELNPVMALYLEHGSVTFVLEKLLFTAVAVLIFCVFNHFAITRISLALAIVIYLGVVFYEVSIMHDFFVNPQNHVTIPVDRSLSGYDAFR